MQSVTVGGMQSETLRTDAKGNLAGWAFGVPSCFFHSAMGLSAVKDEVRQGRPGVWRRSRSPLRAFKVGDIFYEPPAVRDMVWGRALKKLQRCAQVFAATTDRIDSQRGLVAPGQVDFKVTRFEHGAARQTTSHRATQQEFEEFLRTGRLPSAPTGASRK